MLDPNATISSIWALLADGRLYTARVYQMARKCENEHGNASITIGVTGTGQKPCYRVTYVTDDGAHNIWGSFWDMGDPLENEQAINQNWSGQSMTIAEVKALLESIRPDRR